MERLKLTEKEKERYSKVIDTSRLEDLVVIQNNNEIAITPKEEYKGMKTKIEGQQSTIESLKESNKGLNKKISEMVTEQDRVVSKYNEVSDALEVLKKKEGLYEAQEHKISQQKTLMDDKVRKIQQLESRVQELEKKSKEDAETIEGLRIRTGLKSEGNSTSNAEIIAKNKRVMELETEVETQKVEIKGLKEQIEKATTEISNLRNMPAKVVEIEIEPADYQEAKERVQSLEGSVRTLKEENEGLTSKVSELESDLALAEQVKEDALEKVKELMEKTSITSTTSASTQPPAPAQEHTDEEYEELEKKYDELVKDKENLEYDITLLNEKLDKAKESGTQQVTEQPRVKKMNRVQVSKADDLFGGVNYQAKYEEEHKLREKAEKEVREWNEWYKGNLQKNGSNDEDDENKGRRYATGYVNGANFVAEAYGITLREDLKQMISANSRKKG